MKTNWKVRIKNKSFWLTAVPAALLLVQAIASVFGFSLELGDIGNKILVVVDVVFILLAALGIWIDPTTKGLSDSAQAMTYEKPKGEEDA